MLVGGDLTVSRPAAPKGCRSPSAARFGLKEELRVDTIWDDSDVAEIVDMSSGLPRLRLGDLPAVEQGMVSEFIAYDQMVDDHSSDSLVSAACCVGIKTVELMADPIRGTNATGWKKFVTYMTAINARLLWENHAEEAAGAFGGWAIETLESVGVGADGFATELGRTYSSTMAIPGAGVVQDPITGQFRPRGGDDGRGLAGL